MYFDGLVNSKYLGKEPLEFRGYKIEKRARDVVKHLGKRVGHRASHFILTQVCINHVDIMGSKGSYFLDRTVLAAWARHRITT